LCIEDADVCEYEAVVLNLPCGYISPPISAGDDIRFRQPFGMFLKKCPQRVRVNEILFSIQEKNIALL